MHLPTTVYINDAERLTVNLVDHLDPGLHERLRPADLVSPYASCARRPAYPAPVRGHLVVSSNHETAGAFFFLNGDTIRVTSGGHPLEARLSPLRAASPDETVEFALRWLIGIDRLSRWRLAFDASFNAGVNAMAVVALRFEDLESVCRREGLEGVALVRGSAALLERESAPEGASDSLVTVVPCRGGFRGPILAAVWPRDEEDCERGEAA